MKFKPKRAKVTTPRSLSETIDVIVRFTQAVEVNVKKEGLPRSRPAYLRRMRRPLRTSLSVLPTPWSTRTISSIWRTSWRIEDLVATRGPEVKSH